MERKTQFLKRILNMILCVAFLLVCIPLIATEVKGENSTYTVNFNTNGGTPIDSITVTSGEKYGKLPSSSITGLSGGDSNWYLEDENGNVTETNIKNNSIVNTMRNHTLFVKRKILAPTLKITLQVPGAISDKYQYYVPGNSTRILTATISNMNTEVLDYTYQWYKDETAIDGAISETLILDGNVSDSGTYKVVVTATLKDGSIIIVTENSASSEKEQSVKIMHATNTLYYDANGGEDGPSSNYTGGTTIKVQSDEPTRDGYLFNGWNTKADGTGENYDGGSTYTFADNNGNGGCKVTLYAQWVKVYDLYVGGVKVNEANKNDIFGDGKASYDVETETLTLNNINISQGYEYKDARFAGIYSDCDLTINLIGDENQISAPDSTVSSYGIRVLGDLSISGEGDIIVNGGSVSSTDRDANSIGIRVDGWLSITGSNVYANGGSAVVNGEGFAYSDGVYVESGLEVDFDGFLTAKGGKAQGTEAYSSGIEAIGSEDDYINLSVYSGYLNAEGGEAVGIDYAGSTGIYISYGGLYLYEINADAFIYAGKAEVIAEDQEKTYAYSNGIYVYAGDVGIEAGNLEVSSGSFIGENGDAYAVYIVVDELEDDNGNPYIVGGNFIVECDEVKPSSYTPNLVGTTVTINSSNGNAIHADGGIDISDKLIISLPENGVVSGVGGSVDADNWIEPDYWTVLDSNDAEAQNVVIKPLSYKVSLKGLSYSMAVMVPTGDSINETYCELYEIDDFSELLNTKKDGYTFGGWYINEACTDGNEFSFDDSINADITIYAKWVPVEIDDDTMKDDDTPSDNTQTDGDTEKDNNKPTDGTSTNTGDNTNLWLWFAPLFVSGAGIFGIVLNEHKKRMQIKDK